MPWTSLGTVTVSNEWQNFPDDLVGAETVRVLQSYNTPPWGHLTLAQYFPVPGGRGGFRRVIPDVLPTILDLEIPRELREQGQVVRTAQIRHSLPEYANLIWTVELQALY